ncbi:DUF2946 family protein [Pseudophaeobacter profundi]|uniref:DUF2946 family protein n=1 Tax=Pseudophaeobacter profundi TaxID=3034152 RepID=UPI00242C4CFE|nr:DUF2946 family protein [Pseudophaeobacter profundi]
MLSRLLPYVMLLAITAAGLIPAGWMPAHAGNGKVLLVICTTDGVEERWVDLGDDAPQPIPADQMDDRSCPFSALSTHGNLPQNTPLVLDLTPSLGARWAHESFTHYSAGFHWRYDARGPPALS